MAGKRMAGTKAQSEKEQGRLQLSAGRGQNTDSERIYLVNGPSVMSVKEVNTGQELWRPWTHHFTLLSLSILQ